MKLTIAEQNDILASLRDDEFKVLMICVKNNMELDDLINVASRLRRKVQHAQRKHNESRKNPIL
jgi:hypothetical protein